MPNSGNANETLEVISQVLIRCVFIGIFVLLVWWGALLLGGDLAYSVQSKMVPLSRSQFNLIHYCGMLMTKATISLLFLFPYIAIRLVLRNRRK